MNQGLVNTCQGLIEAVTVVMDPEASQSSRHDAFNLCENFKEKSTECVSCGLCLSGKDQPDVIRHFGLQLLEHAVKFRSLDDGLNIRAEAMKLLASGTDLLTEPSYIKNALVKIVVELLKRLWPQEWPTFLSEMSQISQIGLFQVELVFMVFLRLSEDVIQFQNIPTQRRRDIAQGLTHHMDQLFPFFLDRLNSHVTAYQELKDSLVESEVSEALAQCKVSQSILTALTGFVEWINMTYIMSENGLLLRMLCVLLGNQGLQFCAVDVLNIIVNRKGKAEDRKPLLMLFSEESMSTILQAAAEAAKDVNATEYHYCFLKKLGQLLTAIGGQLTYLWGNADGVSEQPEYFSKYLESILALTEYPSQTMGSYCYILWASFLRHDQISRNHSLRAILPQLITASAKSILRVGFPTHHDHPSCRYSNYDFDSDEDFNLFFSRFRAEIAEVIRQTTILNSAITFSYVSDWLKTLLGDPVELGQGAELDHCNLSSPSFLQWDAVCVFLESVMSRANSHSGASIPPTNGIELFKAVLSYESQDPLILSCLMSCVSALFVFLSHAIELLTPVLQKIFSTVVFNLPGQTKGTRSKAVKNVRRHACSILVRICKQYPNLLLSGFETLYGHIKAISEDPNQLSQMEKCTLMEALILINNEFKDFEKQSLFIADVLNPVKEKWLSRELQSALHSTEKFMSFIGIDCAPVEPSSEDTCGINRSHVSYCLNTILAVMKRSKWPQDYELCKAGGFIQRDSKGTSVQCNPATPHIIELLGNLLKLFRCLNELWLPENIARRHPDFAKAYDLDESEKMNILGIQPPCKDNTDHQTHKCPLERMQTFISSAHDNSCHILGNAGQCLGYQFYTVPNLAVMLLGSVQPVIADHQLVPDFRMKLIIRVFLKQYIQHCPEEFYEPDILPVLSAFCPFMLQRLEAKWLIINQRSAEGVELDDNPESQEIIDDQLTRQVTREYLQLVSCICFSKKADTPRDTFDDAMVEETEASSQNDEVPGELGQLVIRNELIYPSLILCAYHALAWRYSFACIKCLKFCWPLTKMVCQENKMTSELACHLLMYTLFGLQQNGQHDACQSGLINLGLQIYETLKPTYSELEKVLLEIPNCSNDSIRVLDGKLNIWKSTKISSQSDRKRKEAFRKIVTPVIGKCLSEKFKREILIRDLPPMFRKKKKVPTATLR